MKRFNDQTTNDKGQFTPVHGGEKAIKQLAHGDPLTGLAAESEAAVRLELANDGISGIVERDAVRLQAVADLFYQALQAAADAGNLDKVESYAQRFTWITAAALRAWAASKDLAKSEGKNTVIDLLKGGKNGV